MAELTDRYLELPNYVNNLRELGFDDDDFADGGSDRFLDTMVVWGSATPSRPACVRISTEGPIRS
ncbi:MAG TPA: hypothetical protein VIJ34_10750 [Acidimicrobiales bacterium]